MKKKCITQIDIEIGARVKAIRTKNGLSQEKMAARLGIESRAFYQNVEKGRNRLTYEQLLTICEEFNVTMDFLFTGKVSSNMEFEIFFESLQPKRKLKQFLTITINLCGDKESQYVQELTEILNKLE